MSVFCRSLFGFSPLSLDADGVFKHDLHLAHAVALRVGGCLFGIDFAIAFDFFRVHVKVIDLVAKIDRVCALIEAALVGREETRGAPFGIADQRRRAQNDGLQARDRLQFGDCGVHIEVRVTDLACQFLTVLIEAELAV